MTGGVAMVLLVCGFCGALACYHIAKDRNEQGRSVTGLAAAGMALGLASAFSGFYLMAKWIQ